jgi:hypothetical protein
MEPRCCDKEMNNIGEINKPIQISDGNKIIGMRDTTLYQCSNCKTIKLE